MNRACGSLTPEYKAPLPDTPSPERVSEMVDSVGGDTCRVQRHQEYYSSSGVYDSSTPIPEVLILRTSGQVGSELER